MSGEITGKGMHHHFPVRPVQWANPQSSSRLHGEMLPMLGSPQQLTLSETLLNNAKEVVRVPRVNETQSNHMFYL